MIIMQEAICTFSFSPHIYKEYPADKPVTCLRGFFICKKAAAFLKRELRRLQRASESELTKRILAKQGFLFWRSVPPCSMQTALLGLHGSLKAHKIHVCRRKVFFSRAGAPGKDKSTFFCACGRKLCEIWKAAALTHLRQGGIVYSCARQASISPIM